MLNPYHVDMGIPMKEKLILIVDGEELAENMQIQDTD